jgi:hypothetical protein
MAVSKDMAYDHPTYTVMRQFIGTSAALAGGNAVEAPLSFRTRVAAVVTGISVILASIGSGSAILTLMFNGSVAAALTLGSASANENIKDFTMTANRTMTSMTDRYEISSSKDKGQVTVIYQYKVVPGATYSLAAALS